MEGIEHIAGSEQLVAVFGYWPSFHDAEVIWLKLSRRNDFGGFGPVLESLVHAFEMTQEVDENGFFVLRHHVLVHLRFAEVDVMRLEGFNHQNALFELVLEDIRDRQLERAKWSVEFSSAYGVWAAFQCHAVEVVRVTPCDKCGEPL